MKKLLIALLFASSAAFAQTVPPASSVTDSSGSVWTFGAAAPPAGFQILRNGQTTGGQGSEISYANGLIEVFALGQWYGWNGTWYVTGPPGGGNSGGYAPGFPIFLSPPAPPPNGGLVSFMMVDTGPYAADGSVHVIYWTNNTGQDINIVKAYIWTGVDRGAIMDVHVELRRDYDNSYLAILQWDHYADPTVPQHGQQFDFSSFPMLLEAGEQLRIFHFAQQYVAPAGSLNARHDIVLWVTYN